MEEDDSTQGQGMGALKYLIILVVVLLLLGGLFAGIFALWRERMDSQTCRQSIELHAKTGFSNSKTYDSFKCPPRYVTVQDADKEAIKSKTAQMMADCYWKFGENKYNLFEGGLVGEYRFCALCHHITFKGSAKGQKIDDFRKYLMTQPVSSKYGQGTYADYIMGRPTDPKEITEITMPGTVEIDTSHEYGVMFIYVKNEHLYKVLSGLWGAGIAGGGAASVALYTGGAVMLLNPVGLVKLSAITIISAAAGGAIGSSVGNDKPADWQSAVLLIPYDEENIRKLDCTQLPIPQGNK
jgi:hypothetical protein